MLSVCHDNEMEMDEESDDHKAQWHHYYWKERMIALDKGWQSNNMLNIKVIRAFQKNDQHDTAVVMNDDAFE